MSQFKTIEEVWAAIDKGLTVYWASDAYQLTIEESNLEWRRRQGFAVPFSNRGEKCLRVTCMSNWFGSLLDANELNRLYTKGS
jgi:hypothetical protein